MNNDVVVIRPQGIGGIGIGVNISGPILFNRPCDDPILSDHRANIEAPSFTGNQVNGAGYTVRVIVEIYVGTTTQVSIVLYSIPYAQTCRQVKGIGTGNGSGKAEQVKIAVGVRSGYMDLVGIGLIRLIAPSFM